MHCRLGVWVVQLLKCKSFSLLSFFLYKLLFFSLLHSTLQFKLSLHNYKLIHLNKLERTQEAQFFMCIAQMILLYDVPTWILGAVCIVLTRAIKRAFLGLFIFILASASVVVAAIVGAMEGHTTDIGFIQGGLLGVLAGVITAVQLFGLMLHSDQPLSKVALMMRRVVNGKAIMGLVRPAVLKAYQWQIMGLDTSNMKISGMYDCDQEPKGLSMNSIQNTPRFYFSCSGHQTISTCSICLQDWEEGQVGRKLERCGHRFHKICIDEWFLRQVTCPICREPSFITH